ncbi:MAG: CapA family protein [Labilithrix sp.]|nr:CapA family protein [Labilithrix sp.]
MPNAVHPRVDSISPRRARWRALAGALLGATAIAGCARESASSGTSTPPRAAVRAGTGPTDPDGTRPALEERDPSAPRHAKPPRLVLAFGGDVIAHDALRVAAARADHRDAAGRSLNDSGYGALIAAIAPAVRGADLAFANLESPVTPRELRRGEMIFHADEPLLAAVARAGFHVVSVASNHALDKGAAASHRHARRREPPQARRGWRQQERCETPARRASPQRADHAIRRPRAHARDELPRSRPSAEPVGLHARGGTAQASGGKRARRARRRHRLAPLGQRSTTARRRRIDAAHRLVRGRRRPRDRASSASSSASSACQHGGGARCVTYSLGNLLSNQGYAFDPRTGKQADGDTRDAAVPSSSPGATTAPGRIADAAAVPLWTDHSAGGDITSSRRRHDARASASACRSRSSTRERRCAPLSQPPARLSSGRRFGGGAIAP